MAHICPQCMKPLAESAKFCPNCGFDQSSYVSDLHYLIPGTMLRERYLVGKNLGEGGFGITYVGLDTLFDRKVAIKEFYMAGYVSRINTYSATVQVSMSNYADVFKKNRSRFLDEAHVLAKFHGADGIVGIQDFFQENNTAYIVMDFLEGETLKSYLIRKGPISWQETKKLLWPAMTSLSQVHAHHIIHRDIAPDNIMLTSGGQTKLLDFGAAREFSEGDPHSLSVILKPGYAPMEQYLTKGVQGSWTDVYALCATIYCCLTGVTPQESMARLAGDQTKAPAELGDCPKPVSDVLMHGMAVRREDRIPSMEKLLEELEEAEKAVAIKESEPGEDDDGTILVDPELVRLEQERIKAQKAREEAERLERERQAELDKKNTKKNSKAKLKPVLMIAAVAVIVFAAVIMIKNFMISSKFYQNAEELYASGDHTGAAIAFGKAGNYSDARERSFELWDEIAVRETIITGSYHTVGLKADGTVVAVGSNNQGQCDVSGWTDIVSVSASWDHTVGLKADGTVVAVGRNYDGQCDVSGWTDIVAVSAGECHTVGLKSDGTVVAVGHNDYGQCDVSGWTGIVSVSADSCYTVGLKSDGTVVAVGYNEDGQCDVSGWTDIVAVSAGYSHTVGLKSDGTVVAVGDNDDGQCDLSGWTDIVAVSAGYDHTVGLKADGTVVAVGWNNEGQCDVSGWTDIVAVSAGDYYTVGLKSDGTVVAVGNNEYGQCDVSDWTDIAVRGQNETLIHSDKVETDDVKESADNSFEESESDAPAVSIDHNDEVETDDNKESADDSVQEAGSDDAEGSVVDDEMIGNRETFSAGRFHTVGLKSDGTVMAVGYNGDGRCDVSDWTDIVAVSAGKYNTVGLKTDGTAVALGSNNQGRCDVSDWTDIVAVSAGKYHTVGLKSDGTVVAVGDNDYGQCDVSDWTDIVAVSAGRYHTVGLKSDGTVVAVGLNDDGQCDVSDWTDIVAVSAGGYHTVGLKSDGTVVAVGYNKYGQSDVSGWTDIVAARAGEFHTVGLKADGTVVAVGDNDYGQCDVSDWTDIVAVSAGYYHTVGLKSDGTVVAVGDNEDGQCDVSDWTDIRLPN